MQLFPIAPGGHHRKGSRGNESRTCSRLRAFLLRIQLFGSHGRSLSHHMGATQTVEYGNEPRHRPWSTHNQVQQLMRTEGFHPMKCTGVSCHYEIRQGFTAFNERSRDRVVGIATGYGLDDRGVRVRVPVGSRNFSSPGSGVHPASYLIGTEGSFPAGKAAGALS
jgi:hypothetical protein